MFPFYRFFLWCYWLPSTWVIKKQLGETGTIHKLVFLCCVCVCVCGGGGVLLIVESVQIEDDGGILEIILNYYVSYLVWNMGRFN